MSQHAKHLVTSHVASLLTLNLLTTTIVAPPSNASKWQMGFNSAFKGLTHRIQIDKVEYSESHVLAVRLSYNLHVNLMIILQLITSSPRPDTTRINHEKEAKN